MLQMFSICLEQSTFPEPLKKTRVVPVFKKGTRSNPEIYRPIGLLSSFSKVFEKVIWKPMRKFFRKNKHFTVNQYDSRKKRSCTHAIGEVKIIFEMRWTNVTQEMQALLI